MPESLLPEPDWIPERPSDEALIAAKNQIVEAIRFKAMRFLRNPHERQFMSAVTGSDLSIDLTGHVMQPDIPLRSKVTLRRGKPPENNGEYASDFGALMVFGKNRSDWIIRSTPELDRPVIADVIIREYILAMREWIMRNIHCIDDSCDIDELVCRNTDRGRMAHKDILDGTFGWQYEEIEDPQPEEPEEARLKIGTIAMVA